LLSYVLMVLVFFLRAKIRYNFEICKSVLWHFIKIRKFFILHSSFFIYFYIFAAKSIYN